MLLRNLLWPRENKHINKQTNNTTQHKQTRMEGTHGGGVAGVADLKQFSW